MAKAEADAQARIAVARGEAEANRLLAESLRANPEVVRLKAVERWDGKLPVYMGGSAPVPFINTN